jgi:DNA-binding response OmpR family regulator
MKSPHRILIVDDEPTILFAFSQYLKSPTVIIETASTFEEAVDVLKRQTFGAVIADLRLTGTTNIEGYEVIRQARRLQPSSKIMVVTAYGGDDIKKTIHDLGADYYFEKPVSPQKIKEVLAQHGIS